jgi:hypothetical protein
VQTKGGGAGDSYKEREYRYLGGEGMFGGGGGGRGRNNEHEQKQNTQKWEINTCGEINKTIKC